MRLLRVQVPDFRVLKNIDISFEKDFFPNIFPLASQNGGGKSTLLQLIFILLHCSGDPEKIEYIRNLINGFKIDETLDRKSIATFDISYKGEEIQLEFLVCYNTYINELTSGLLQEDIKDLPADLDINNLDFNLSNFETLKILNEKIINSCEKAQNLIFSQEKFEKILKTENKNDRKNLATEILTSFLEDRSLGFTELISRLKNSSFTIDNNNDSLETFHKYIQEELQLTQSKINAYQKAYETLAQKMRFIENILTKNRMVYICDSKNHQDKDIFMLCKFTQSSQQNFKFFKLFMSEISKKIFLVAPITQVFLFLSSRKGIFRQMDERQIYYSDLEKFKNKTINFFTYDFFFTELVIEYFKEARDLDFAQAIEIGKYGNNYQSLRRDLNSILFNKEINIDKDVSGIVFKLKDDENHRELYPEDLSHGELKRLSIYVWLKYRKIEDAIVLMDEIEIALHPDWQYKIIDDLQEWGPSNQYILTTHSYELCQALTPAHVKEIEPKLLPTKTEKSP